MSQPLPPTHVCPQLWAQWDFTASVFGSCCSDGCDGDDGVDGGVGGDGGDGDGEDGNDEVSDDYGDDDHCCYCVTNGKELERGNDLLRVTQLIHGRV